MELKTKPISYSTKTDLINEKYFQASIMKTPSAIKNAGLTELKENHTNATLINTDLLERILENQGIIMEAIQASKN